MKICSKTVLVYIVCFVVLFMLTATDKIQNKLM